MKPFVLTQKAKADMKEIAKFTMRRWGREKRNLYLKEFDEAFFLLAERPSIGKLCDEIRKGYRKFPQGSHIIFYTQIDKTRINIIRILHKNMDVDIHFSA